MALGKHERAQSERFRKERADSLARTCAGNIRNSRMSMEVRKLGTLKKELDADSLNEVRRKLRSR